MSNTFDPEQIKKIASEAEQKEKLKKITDAVRLHESTQKLRRIVDGKQLQSTLTEIDFTTDFDELSDAAKEDAFERDNSIEFMFSEMNDFVQLAPGSLALLCAATGTGKSTLTANAAYSLLRQGKRVLIIANEEKRTDVAARISCLQLDVNIHKYKSKNGLPDTIKNNVLDNIKTFDPKQLSIIALDFKNDSRIVTSPEGMIKLLENATDKFDAIIIDYYQNINQSINNPGLQPHEANEIFAKEVDHLKNEVGCPIIMMAQIRRGDDDYKTRLEGRRLILNKCTDVFEVKIDKAYNRSMLICHKDRWLGNQGEERFIGYVGGKYVPYTREFEEATKANKRDAVDALAGDPKPDP
jgi:replicative DNA helicase